MLKTHKSDDPVSKFIIIGCPPIVMGDKKDTSPSSSSAGMFPVSSSTSLGLSLSFLSPRASDLCVEDLLLSAAGTSQPYFR